MSIFELVLLFIVIIIVIIIAVLNAIAASRLTDIKSYDSDSNLQRAHVFLTWSSVFGWLGIFILVGLAAYYFGKTDSEKSKVSQGTGVRIFLFATTVLIFITGILSASAAVEMDKNTQNKAELDESGARGLANWAAVLGIIGSVMVIIALVTSYYYRESKKKKTTMDKDTEKNSVEMENIKMKDL